MSFHGSPPLSFSRVPLFSLILGAMQSQSGCLCASRQEMVIAREPRGRQSLCRGAVSQGWVRSSSPLCCHLPSSTDLPTLSLCFAHRQPGSPGWPKPGFGQKWSRLRRVKDRSLDGWRRLLGINEGAEEGLFLVAYSPLSHDLWLWPLTGEGKKKEEKGKRKKKVFKIILKVLLHACVFIQQHKSQTAVDPQRQQPIGNLNGKVGILDPQTVQFLWWERE